MFCTSFSEHIYSERLVYFFVGGKNHEILANKRPNIRSLVMTHDCVLFAANGLLTSCVIFFCRRGGPKPRENLPSASAIPVGEDEWEESSAPNPSLQSPPRPNFRDNRDSNR